MRKLMEISFYTCVPKTTIIWDFQNFEKIKKAYEGVIILYMCTKNHNHMVYASWDMGATTQYSVILGHFVIWVILLLLAPKIKNWKKIRRYFLFHMCKINKDSWDIKHYRQKFLSFCAIFCPFIPPANQ